MKKLVLFISVVSLTACNTLSEEELPESFRFLKEDVASAQESLNLLDSSKVWGDFEKIRPYYDHLKSTEFDSAMTEVYIKDLTWMNRYERALQKWGTRTEGYVYQIERSAKQLEDLGHDLQHQLLDSTEMNTFIETEHQAIDQIVRDIQERGGEIFFYSEKVDSMKARLDSIFPDIE